MVYRCALSLWRLSGHLLHRLPHLKKPATFKRFAAVVCYAVGVVWVVLAGVLALYFILIRVIGDNTRGPDMDPPSWFAYLGLSLSAVAVVVAWVQYKRGALDEYDSRRHGRAV